MVQPYYGQINAVGFNFAPRNWSICAGQQVGTGENESLFSLLGYEFGQNGDAFLLPDLRGRVLIGYGQGPLLSNYNIGQRGGSEQQNVPVPQHSHVAQFTPSSSSTLGVTTELFVAKQPGTSREPTTGAYLGEPNQGALGNNLYIENKDVTKASTVQLGGLHSSIYGGVAGNVTVNDTGQYDAQMRVVQPYTAINYCIALQGAYPFRN